MLQGEYMVDPTESMYKNVTLNDVQLASAEGRL
jgi:hypothetical protein